MFLLDWPGGSWEATLKLSLLILGLYIAAIWIACIFWTYRDIRQRTRDPLLQAASVAVVVVLFLPGLWIYLILRPRYTLVELYERSLEEEALLQELEDQSSCPTCRRRVHEDYLVCPTCRTQLKESCVSCGKPLNYAWQSCPYCATDKAPSQGPQRQRRSRPATPGGRENKASQARNRTTATASSGETYIRRESRGGDPVVDATGSE